MANYFFAEQMIIDHLRANIQTARVLSITDLVDVSESQQITPALHVMYDGDTVEGADEGRTRGVKRKVTQYWMVVVAVRNARNTDSANAARQDAGELIDATIRVLSGYKLTPDKRPLERVSAPPPAYSEGGYAYFPIRFALPVIW